MNKIKHLEQFNKVDMPMWICNLIAFSGFCIFISWDETFNMQVIFPIMLIVIVGTLIINKCSITIDANVRIGASIILIMCISLLFNYIFNPNIVNSLSIVRLFYTSLIIIYFCTIFSYRVSLYQLKHIININRICSFFIATGIIINWLNGAEGKISVVSIWNEMIEENYTAAILSFSIVLEAILFLNATRIRKNVKREIVFIAVMVWALFLTGSRAAIVSLIVCFIILAYQFVLNSGRKIEYVIFYSIITLVFLFVLFFLAKKFLPQFIYQRMIEKLFSGLNDRSNKERLQLWINGLEGFLKQPLIGYGVGNFAIYTHKIFPQHSVVVAHNTFIDLLVDSGLIGFCLYIKLFISNMHGILKNNKFIYLPLIFSWGFTSFIVGAERTFFFWNELILLCLLAKFNLNEVYSHD